MVLNAKRRTIDVGSESPLASDLEGEGGDDKESTTSHLEPWPDFLRRTARWAEDQLASAGISEWLDAWRARQWKWAGQVAKNLEKWSSVATVWDPLLHASGPRGRRQARPKKRWEQDIIIYLEHVHQKAEWKEVAKNSQWWKSHLEDFVEFYR